MAYDFNSLDKVKEEQPADLKYYRDYTNIADTIPEVEAGKKDNVSMTLAQWIRQKVYGRDVRESIAQFVEWVSVLTNKAIDKVDDTAERQTTVEEQFKAVLNETSSKDVISAPEIIAARGGKATLGERLDETNAQLAEKVNKDELTYVTPEMFGAVGDGVTDDTIAIQSAFNSAKNVKFSGGKTYVITNSINVLQTLISVDFGNCNIKSKTTEPCFKVNKDNPKTDYLGFTAKNCNVWLSEGGTFILFNECYFTSLKNIRITGVHNNYPAIKYINGFNHSIKECTILGTSDITGTGVLFEANEGYVDPTFNQFTNCNLTDCLIQRCNIGVSLVSNHDTARFDTNVFFNVGFSSCNYAIKSDIIENSWFMNNIVDTCRIENSECGLCINGNTTLKNLYIYNTKTGIEQNDSNAIKFEGTVIFLGNNDVPFGETVNNVDLSCAKLSFNISNEHDSEAIFKHSIYLPPNSTKIYTGASNLIRHSDVIYNVGEETYVDASNIRTMLLKFIGSKITFTNTTDHNFNINGLHKVGGVLSLLASSQTQSRSLTFTAKDENTIVYW